VEKRITLLADGVALDYRATGLAGRWQVQLNLAMPSCDGFAGRYVLADGTVPCGFGQDLALESVATLRLEDGVLGGAITLSVEPPARLAARPHLTVSQSEAGFEKIMQAVEITLSWPMAAPPAGSPAAAFRISLQAGALPTVPHTL
jgi:alpha-amylase